MANLKQIHDFIERLKTEAELRATFDDYLNSAILDVAGLTAFARNNGQLSADQAGGFADKARKIQDSLLNRVGDWSWDAAAVLGGCVPAYNGHFSDANDSSDWTGLVDSVYRILRFSIPYGLDETGKLTPAARASLEAYVDALAAVVNALG